VVENLKVTVDTSKYGIPKITQPTFSFPKGHDCYGCVFVSGRGRVGLTPPCKDPQTCIYAFYKKIYLKKKGE